MLLRPPPCPSSGSGSPLPRTSQAVPGIWTSVSLGDHYFTCHMLAGSGSQAGGQARAPVVGAPSPNHQTNREPQTPGNINWSEASQRSSSQHQDPALSNCLQTPVLDVPGQTTSKTRIQHHPSKKKKQQQQKNMLQGFPGGAVVGNPPANAGDTGSSPGPGRSHMPQSNSSREPQLLSPCATTTEARVPTARAPQQEKPPQ